MPFDLATAKPEPISTGFDLATAKPTEQSHIGNDLENVPLDILKGANLVAATGFKSLSLAGATIPLAIDKAFGTKLADKWYSLTTAPLDKIKEDMAVRPDAGVIGKISHTVGGVAGTIIGAQLTMPAAPAASTLQAATDLWPTITGMLRHGIGAMAAPSMSSAIESGQKVFEHTNDGLAAFNAAKSAYLTSTAMAIIPFSAGGNVAVRAASGFAAGTVTGEVNRQYTNNNMPTDMQTPATFEDALLNGIIGAGFGVFGPRGNPTFVKPKELSDAATVLAGGDPAKAKDLNGKLAAIVEKTGIPPSQVVADAHADPTIKADLMSQPADSATHGKAADATNSAEIPIPVAYVPIAREMMVKNTLPDSQHALNIAAVMENPMGKITSEKAPNHINYKYVESPEDVKAVHARISEVFEKQIEAVRGKESWDTTQAKAMEIIKNSGLQANGGDFKNLAARAMAWESMAQKAAFDVAEAARNVRAKGPEATPEDIKAQVVAIENLAFLQAVDQGNGAEIARALNARKAAKQMADIARNTSNLFTQYGHDPHELARMIGEIDTKEGMAKFAKEATKASTWEKLIEGWKSGLVSGPVTHLANIMGNTTFATMRVPIDALAATIGALRGAPVGERLSAFEPLARMAGILEGTKNGLKIGAAMLAKEDAMVGKAESFRHAIEGKKGEIIRLPFRALGAEDAVFKAMNESGETFALATRQAITEGLNPTTREFRERTIEIMQNPSPEMVQQIWDAGQRYTFNADMGDKGHAVQSFVKTWHLEFMVPFIRTPGNIAKELIRMTPFAPAIKEWRTAIAEGGIARDHAMAEVMLGTGIMSAIFSYALDGQISGAGDPDPAKRRVAMAAGWQPYSIKINGTWYNYQRLQPVGTLMGMAADIGEVWHRMDANESDKIPKMLSVAFANAITSQTFLQGFTNIIRALDEPERFGPKLVEQFAASSIPNIVGQPTAMLDPVGREVNSVREAVMARIPGLRDNLLPNLDVFGQPIQTRERLGAVSPITESDVSNDKVRTEAARLGVGVAKAPKSVELPSMHQKEIGKVTLTPEQQNQFTGISGKLAHDILRQIVGSDSWDGIPDMMKKSVYEKVFNKTREVARMQVIPPEQKAAEMRRIADELIQQIQGKKGKP